MASRSFLKNLGSGLKLFIDFVLGLSGYIVMAVVAMAFLIIIPILMTSAFLWEVGQNLESETPPESIDNNA